MKKIFTFFIAIFLPWSVYARPEIHVLNDSDAIVYDQIFKLQSKEKIDSAKKIESKLSDKILMNEVLYQRFVSKTYRTRGAELKSWMAKYYDMPGATRLQKLAKRKKATVHDVYIPHMVTGTPSIENAQSETWTAKQYAKQTQKSIARFKSAIRGANMKKAANILQDSKFKHNVTESDYGRLAGRLAFLYYTNGESEMAKKWGFIASDANSEYGLWTLGLLYFKEEKFEESAQYFSKILELQQINDARKIEAAFWAGRAAYANGDRSEAKSYWKIGAAYPMAFYGALSATMLGDAPEYEFFEQEATDEDIAELAKSKYGKMALALMQVGQTQRAEEYLKYLITAKASDRTLHAINSVATDFAMPRVAIQVSGVVRDRGILEIDDDIIYSAQYPLPDWEPMGGWSIDRALLLAITKQESGFKPTAKSNAGANGLMQIMPSTAKSVARKNKVNLAEMDILNPEHNMFLGQQYIVDLLARPEINNNIIKMLVAYNSGLGKMTKFEKSFTTDDPLLYIESFPVNETRIYIKRVMSNLWLYRARLGQPQKSMRDLTDGVWPLYNSEDAYVKQQILNRISI